MNQQDLLASKSRQNTRKDGDGKAEANRRVAEYSRAVAEISRASAEAERERAE